MAAVEKTKAAPKRIETTDIVYGRLLESVHIAGYTWKRAGDELNWLIDEDRWQTVGGGFDDVDVFLSTIDLSEFKLAIEQRKNLVKKLDAIRASGRAIARALGVGHGTVQRDLADPSGSPTDEEASNEAESGDGADPSGSPTRQEWFQRDDFDPAKAGQKQARQSAKQAKQHEAVEVPEWSEGDPCNVWYVDPPWRYDANSSPASRAIENHYPTMDLDAICALGAEDENGEHFQGRLPADAVLFLWATSPKLADAIKVMEAWGFDYRTNAVWVKDKIGMGYYFRQRHELLLVGRRGDMPVPEPSDRIDSVIEAPRAEHSEKPQVVYEIIEAMYPTGHKIEVFSRADRPGWEAWGHRVTVAA